jgi:hypothetical protein
MNYYEYYQVASGLEGGGLEKEKKVLKSDL